jgi:hypothetical protein
VVQFLAALLSFHMLFGVKFTPHEIVVQFVMRRWLDARLVVVT